MFKNSKINRKLRLNWSERGVISYLHNVLKRKVKSSLRGSNKFCSQTISEIIKMWIFDQKLNNFIRDLLQKFTSDIFHFQFEILKHIYFEFVSYVLRKGKWVKSMSPWGFLARTYALKWTWISNWVVLTLFQRKLLGWFYGHWNLHKLLPTPIQVL